MLVPVLLCLIASATNCGVFGAENVTESNEIRTEAFQKSCADVDRAVNNTLNELIFNAKSKTSLHALAKRIRFPDKKERALARSAEVFERTLYYLKKAKLSEKKSNITDDALLTNEISQAEVNAVANLAGCSSHLLKTNCSDLCFHSKYRTIDGSCNNLQHPTWGAAMTGFRRILQPIYEDGIMSTPLGWTKSMKHNGFELPLARAVSVEIIKTEEITQDEEITHMVMQWGQFIDHDLTHTVISASIESYEGKRCIEDCVRDPPCFPIEIPDNDPRINRTNHRCMEFIRNMALHGSREKSGNTPEPRVQINRLTAFIDGTQIYGFSPERLDVVRDKESPDGILREQYIAPFKKPLLPTAVNKSAGDPEEVDCRNGTETNSFGCFLAGDLRINEQLGLTAMHTIWFREHNRIARIFRKLNPTWDSDTIFHEARKLVAAEIQHIAYSHWLPNIIGEEGIKMLGKYPGYDPNVDSSIANVFATAVLRVGHTIINPVLYRLDENFTSLPDLQLRDAFFAPWRIVKDGALDPLMRGFFMKPAKRKRPTQNLNSELIDHLFEASYHLALDLAATNIQRSRDHGIPGYNEWRKYCKLSDAKTMDDLKKEISNSTVREKLRKLYGHPANIDVWVGGILEDQAPGARVGPLLRCLFVEQFKRIRDGDRFWYENPSTFTPDQLTQIKQTSLARVLCDNGDNITRITKDVFKLPNLQKSGIVNCTEIPSVNLKVWIKPSEGCHSTKGEKEDTQVKDVANELGSTTTEAL